MRIASKRKSAARGSKKTARCPTRIESPAIQANPAGEDLATNEKAPHFMTGEERRGQITNWLANACAVGDLEAAKWIISKGFTDVADIRELDRFVLAMAFHHNQLVVVQFLVEHFELVAADVFEAGWANYSLDCEAAPAMYAWMHDTYGPEKVD